MRLIGLLIAFLVLPGSVWAQPSFYVGANLGASQFDGRASADQNGLAPFEISINGFTFDSTETAWGAFFGWNAKSWLALEVGYSDLGNAGETLFTAVPLTPLIVPSIGVPSPIAPLPPSVVAGRPIGVATRGVALEIEEWYVGTRFSVPLSSRFKANWFAGISRASFESEGGIPRISTSDFIFFVDFFPFASPDNETGLVWGFGFDWEANERLSLDLDFRRHDTQVLDVDTMSLGLLFSF